MLENWSITNFKSFNAKTELLLKPLTLICGANSSGKSSVVQSILLIKQTLQHAPPSRAIALNGPLVRLGTFNDIENSQARESKEHSVGIGWRLKRLSRPDRAGFYEEEADAVSVDFEFDSRDGRKENETADLQPNLRSVHISGEYRDLTGDNHHLDLLIARNTGKGRKLIFNTSTINDSTGIIPYKISSIDDETRVRALEAKPNAKLAGCLTRHFFPADIVIRYDRSREVARYFVSSLLGNRPVGARRLASTSMPVPQKIKHAIAERIAPFLHDDGKLSPLSRSRLNEFRSIHDFLLSEEPVTIQEFIQRFSHVPPVIRRQMREQIHDIAKTIEADLYEALGSELTLAPARLDIINSAHQLTDSFFRFAVRYLGPLRDEPRPLYPLQALSSPTDVGPKGELTAAVLHLNERRSIDYIPSSSFTADEVSPRTQSAKLRDAVEDWLRYLKVAVAFETSEKGKFGHELRIKTVEAGEFQDLTNVGVGVSQILPIVVTCLLAPRGATIILEQPELHLHPAVQARLADFFISMSMLDKQCIIETHGEHLIERIRLRVVSDLSDEILKDTIIYSFEKPGHSTECRKIALNKYGAIMDWPEDFFDQSQKESERIVLKALERRRNERSANKSDG